MTTTTRTRGRIEGRVLVEVRARHGITAAWAASRIRVPLATWARWERSGAPLASLFFVELLCLVLDDAVGLQAIEACAAAARR